MSTQQVSLTQAREDHIRELMLDNRLCNRRADGTWYVPNYWNRCGAPSSYVFRLWQIGSWLGPWQTDARTIEKDTGRLAYAIHTAKPELLVPGVWRQQVTNLRWGIAKAMAKNYNGAPVGGKGSTWLPYDEPSPVWDLAQLPMRATPVVKPFTGVCDHCHALVVRQRVQFDLFWIHAGTGERNCGNGHDHTVKGKAEARTEWTSHAIYALMEDKHPVADIDPTPAAAQVTGRQRLKYRKALVREQKAVGLR